MNVLRKSIALSMAWLLAIQPLLISLPVIAAPTAPDNEVNTFESITERKGIELNGEYVDRTAQMRAERDAKHKPGFGEDGSPMRSGPYARLPIIDDALMQTVRAADDGDEVRVIVHLDFLPHAQVFKDALDNHKQEIDALETQRLALKSEFEKVRRKDTNKDSERYGEIVKTNDAQKAAMRAYAEENERLSGIVKTEVSSRLSALISDSQAPIEEMIDSLGGKVEFATIAGNMVIALMSPDAIEDLAQQPGILRIVEDSLMEGHLTNADNSTRVDPTDTSLIGLWDAGQTGGSFDPAIIDSGTTLNHPGLQDSVSPLRDNFFTWYMVAGVASASFDEACCSQNDEQGHGTHVAGIVGSYGTPAYPNNLGMAYGVEKLVTLKAGWLNTSGTASMFWSDKYNVVDRALYDTGALQPSDSFADDVDGMNLSYGGSTTLDDTDGGRFWDSVISTYSNLPVTISAGNSGPSNANFSDPALSYNAITVANYNDRNTTSLTDDIINSSSTVGPTANGRRKPDLAAPGTSIQAPNNQWVTQVDYVNKSGTSMAAPMVLGVAMDLMDAGIADEVAIKAVLINTAQKNLPGMNIESDADGWDAQLGFGVMNALAAYDHRFDYFTDSLAPRDTAGDFQLYKGVMRDEGASGEGRDKATMVWNREATYLTDSAPTTYYNLVDVNLRLYGESNNGLIDFDTDADDNVHQVRIGSGAGDTEVVINAYSWSTTFDHGGATQSVTLATEEDFVRVDLPATFQGIAIWPTEVEPNEVFNIEFWLRNDSEIASHNNQFDLNLPAGFTLLSGIDTQNVGSVSAGGTTTHVNYTVRAPAVVGAGQNIVVAHSHSSYNESYGSFNWNMGINVAVDVTPPNPNPMTFSIAPAYINTTSLDMQATFASDLHGPADYFLQYWNSPSGGAGGASSGWQPSRDWVDVGLTSNNQYCYRAWARDNANSPNLTSPSSILCAYTLIFVPNSLSFGNVTNTSIAVSSNGVFNNLTLDLSGVQVRNTTNGSDSGWQQNTNEWTSFGLTPATGYQFDSGSRNGDGVNTGFTAAEVRYTLANPPAVDLLSPASDTEIKVVLNPNGNSNQAEYLIQNTTTGTNSGWITDTSYLDEGLTCNTTYNYQARARNGDGVETFIVPLGSTTTEACGIDTDGDGVVDSADNCTLVSNADQRDTNNDGYGNICDPDLDNNGFVNFLDFSALTSLFGTATTGDADLNGDGLVNFIDISIAFPAYFGGSPGPSGIAP